MNIKYHGNLCSREALYVTVLFTYMFVSMNITDSGVVGSESSMNMKYTIN